MSTLFFITLILTLIYVLNNQILNIYYPQRLTKYNIIKDNIILCLTVFCWIWVALGDMIFTYIVDSLICILIFILSYYKKINSIKQDNNINTEPISFDGKQGVVTEGTDGSFSIGRLDGSNELIMLIINDGHQIDMIGKRFEIVGLDENNKAIIRGKIINENDDN